jgi:hypothetical protein
MADKEEHPRQNSMCAPLKNEDEKLSIQFKAIAIKKSSEYENVYLVGKKRRKRTERSEHLADSSHLPYY